MSVSQNRWPVHITTRRQEPRGRLLPTPQGHQPLIERCVPFRLDLPARTLRRRAHNAVDRWDTSTYPRFVDKDGGPVALSVTHDDALGASCLSPNTAARARLRLPSRHTPISGACGPFLRRSSPRWTLVCRPASPASSRALSRAQVGPPGRDDRDVEDIEGQPEQRLEAPTRPPAIRTRAAAGSRAGPALDGEAKRRGRCRPA